MQTITYQDGRTEELSYSAMLRLTKKARSIEQDYSNPDVDVYRCVDEDGQSYTICQSYVNE